MHKHESGLIDMSVVIDLGEIPVEALPVRLSIAAITLAELAAGPHAATNAGERARRQERLQTAEATFHTIPFGSDAARAYGRVYGAAVAAGRSSRSRIADSLIAATAIASNLPLYTRNATDFAHVASILEIVEI